VRGRHNMLSRCKWWLEQSGRAFRLEVIAHVNDARLRVPLCTPIKFEVGRSSPEEDAVDYPYDIIRRGDLDLWSFDLGTGAECQAWHGQPSCQLWYFCDFFLELWANTRQTGDLSYVITWLLTFEISAHVGYAGYWRRSVNSIRTPSLKFVGMADFRSWR